MKTGRIVVVTGAAGGMGALIVRRFLSNGDAVIATDTEESALARLRSAEEHRGKLLTFAGDIAKEEDCGRLAASPGASSARSTCSSTAPGSSRSTTSQRRPASSASHARWRVPSEHSITVNAMTPGLTVTPRVKERAHA